MSKSKVTNLPAKLTNKLTAKLTAKKNPAMPLAPRSLTLKEKNVLEFLEIYIQKNGISPSYQEICDHFGFASFNSVQRYLKQLESKSYIHIPWGNQKRAISLLKPSSALQNAAEDIRKENESSMASGSGVELFALPLLGRVAAGAPIEAFEHDEFIDVPSSLVRDATRTYALRVQGQSMIEDGILDGDVILVQKQTHASNGEIVVAMVNEEATVKRFYSHLKKKDADVEKMVELRPANATMSSFWYSRGDVQIRGIVVGLIRKF
jgi:repressor LexA